MKITRHKDLPIWQIAVGLVKECYNVTDSFPPNEKFGLKAQIRRAAVSITPNIAGGSVRFIGRLLRPSVPHGYGFPLMCE